MATDTALTVHEAGPAAGPETLRLPVWNALAERADALRRSLPRRPETPEKRWTWWSALTPEEQRRAVLLDHLDALCGHLAGRPALGYAADDPLPDAALEAADGFTSEETAELVAAYRAARRTARPGPC